MKIQKIKKERKMKETNKLAAACCNLYISNVILLKYYIIVILKVNF